jgi:hypothetical protein
MTLVKRLVKGSPVSGVEYDAVVTVVEDTAESLSVLYGQINDTEAVFSVLDAAAMISKWNELDGLGKTPVDGIQLFREDLNQFWKWNGSLPAKGEFSHNNIKKSDVIEAGNDDFASSGQVRDFSFAYKKEYTIAVSGGEVFNGAVMTEDGFDIPIGQTGHATYSRKMIPIISDKKSYIEFVLNTTELNENQFAIRIDLVLAPMVVEEIVANEQYRITLEVEKTATEVALTTQFTGGGNSTYSQVINVSMTDIKYYSFDEKDNLKMSQLFINDYVSEKKQEIIDNNVFVYRDEIEVINSGEVFNGAVNIDNGFNIPTGQTGQASYSSFYVPIVSDVDGFLELEIFTQGRPISHFSTRINLTVVPLTTVTLVENSHYRVIIPVNYDVDEVRITSQLTHSTVAVDSEDITFENINYYSAEKKEQKNVSQYLIDKKIEAIDISNVTYTTLTCSVDDNTTDFTGRNCIQDAIDSITDASATNRYIVEIANGYYYVLNGSEYKGSPSYPAMITMQDYISINGESEKGVVIHAELPFEDGDIDTAVDRLLHQTLWNYGKESNVSNLTLVGKNIRYTVHMDSGLSANSNRNYENVTVIFEGTKGYLRCFGLGTVSGETNYLKNIKMISSSGTFSCHNNSKFTKASKYFIEGCKFFSQGEDTFFIENNGAIKDCEFNFKNNDLPPIFRYTENWLRGTVSDGRTYFNHAETKITGYGNSPVLFENKVNGDSLLITNKTSGDSSVVTFDETSSAFDILIKNPNAVVGHPIKSENSYYIKDGYYVREGSTSVKSFAFGCIDLSESAATGDSGVNYRSIGKRLGDCSTINKTLGIVINGATYNVVFNQDYTNVSNATIIAEIQTVIDAVADVSTFNYGVEYYLEFTDCVELVKNGTSDLIEKGTVINVYNNIATISNSWNDSTMIALEDIPITNSSAICQTYGSGRALKKGIIIDSFPAIRHFVKTDVAVFKGDLLKPINGVLTIDANGEDICINDGLIAINN